MALAVKQEAGEAERKLHPMFRGRSASGSRSRSASLAAEEQPRKRRKVNGGMVKVEEDVKVEQDVIEVLSDSDEEETLSDTKDGKADKAQ